jgi:hypothetical protein
MIWVILWAVGVIAFLVYFFRGHLRWFLLYVLGIVAFIASFVLQVGVLEKYPGYLGLVTAAARVGWVVLSFAVTVFVVDVIAVMIYTWRHGESDDQKGKVITESRSLSSMSLGYPPLMGWSKRKILGSKSEFVTVESLVAGTATFAQRMYVLGIIIAFVSFGLIWAGIGLMGMKYLLIFILVPVLPGLWVYYNLQDDWKAYRKAKQKLAVRGQ